MYTSTPHAQHYRKKLMSKGQLVAINTIVSHQDPPGEAAVDLGTCIGNMRRWPNQISSRMKVEKFTGDAFSKKPG